MRITECLKILASVMDASNFLEIFLGFVIHLLSSSLLHFLLSMQNIDINIDLIAHDFTTRSQIGKGKIEILDDNIFLF